MRPGELGQLLHREQPGEQERRGQQGLGGDLHAGHDEEERGDKSVGHGAQPALYPGRGALRLEVPAHEQAEDEGRQYGLAGPQFGQVDEA